MAALVHPAHIIPAEDDKDHRQLFQDVLAELPLPVIFMTEYARKQLMQLLNTPGRIPYIVFLDVNMPGNTGLTCLNEIKTNRTATAAAGHRLSYFLRRNNSEPVYYTDAQYYIRSPMTLCN